uniref:Zinc finger, CCHC-type n=1 Tax=Tanacetum cinerariifolium TaxID=118510 RepID=A0A699I7J0_TANCI|nr:zinc finger, CCHC-type [Tanacetum cinerariifolium]
MASMNTRLSIKKLDGNIVQKHGGAQGDREAEAFRVSNDDIVGAQRRLEDKQPEEKINTDCLVKEQEKEYQTWWKIKTGNVFDSCNQRSPSSAIGFKTLIDMLGFFGWLASIEQWMLEPVNVKCIFLGYRKGIVGTGSVQVLQGVEFEVEPQEDHTFEVEPHGNVDHVVGSQNYREDSNEAAFAVAAVDKIYAHDSLNFNDTVACEVISKWKVRLKKDMDVRSDVYVLSNGYRKSSDDSHDYYWKYASAKGNVLGLDIIRDQGGNTLRVSQSRIHNEKLVQTFLKGHSTLSLEYTLSGDCDVEKNGKWSYICSWKPRVSGGLHDT